MNIFLKFRGNSCYYFLEYVVYAFRLHFPSYAHDYVLSVNCVQELFYIP
jgi:hypothetical protein